jgi:hypothetical protein
MTKTFYLSKGTEEARQSLVEDPVDIRYHHHKTLFFVPPAPENKLVFSLSKPSPIYVSKAMSLSQRGANYSN